MERTKQRDKDEWKIKINGRKNQQGKKEIRRLNGENNRNLLSGKIRKD